MQLSCVFSYPRGWRYCSALALLVPRVRADHHDAAVAADDPALAADLLDARLDLHGKLLLVARRAGLVSSWHRGARMPLLVPINDATAAEVIRAELYDHPVVGQNPDVVHPHLPADMGEYLVPVVQLHTEEGIRQRLHHRAFDLDGAVFLGHVLRASSCVVMVGIAAVRSSPGGKRRTRRDASPVRTVLLNDKAPDGKASRWAAAESTVPIPRTRTGSITPKPGSLFQGNRFRRKPLGRL